jgi:hypothetical protein
MGHFVGWGSGPVKWVFLLYWSIFLEGASFQTSSFEPQAGVRGERYILDGIDRDVAAGYPLPSCIVRSGVLGE